MIQTKIYDTWEDGTNLILTYSDANMMIEQVGTGARYAEAIDPDFMGRTYIETDEPIPKEDHRYEPMVGSEDLDEYGENE